ncbi:MAG: hypothetical protein RQ760_03635 [Sedimentisphaerales bacterium]|nr:hypothetical protein [Sedimentisphaerales bacterium]
MIRSGNTFSEDAHFIKPLQSHRARIKGGTIINTLFALIFLGLIGLGIWWIIKSFGQAGEQYTQTMIDTKYTAETVKCQTNLRTIAQNIQIYALSNEGFPSSLQDLIQWSGSIQLFKCPSPDAGEYVYVPGQSNGMSPANVILYESKPVHDGRCSVLRLGGQIELLTPEELQQALAQTQTSIR